MAMASPFCPGKNSKSTKSSATAEPTGVKRTWLTGVGQGVGEAVAVGEAVGEGHGVGDGSGPPGMDSQAN
jgi:hypothetical protein